MDLGVGTGMDKNVNSANQNNVNVILIKDAQAALQDSLLFKLLIIILENVLPAHKFRIKAISI